MDLQKPIDYLQMFTELLSRRAHLLKQRDEAELELAKVRQLTEAIYPLLPPEKQQSYQGTMDAIQADTPGLQEAIRLLFSVRRGQWMSTADVRDYLNEMGFDFRHYQANPLSAISTTLRRMTPSPLEAASNEDEPTKYRLPEDRMYGLGSSVDLTPMENALARRIKAIRDVKKK